MSKSSCRLSSYIRIVDTDACIQMKQAWNVSLEPFWRTSPGDYTVKCNNVHMYWKSAYQLNLSETVRVLRVPYPKDLHPLVYDRLEFFCHGLRFRKDVSSYICIRNRTFRQFGKYVFPKSSSPKKGHTIIFRNGQNDQWLGLTKIRAYPRRWYGKIVFWATSRLLCRKGMSYLNKPS